MPWTLTLTPEDATKTQWRVAATDGTETFNFSLAGSEADVTLLAQRRIAKRLEQRANEALSKQVVITDEQIAAAAAPTSAEAAEALQKRVKGLEKTRRILAAQRADRQRLSQQLDDVKASIASLEASIAAEEAALRAAGAI
jgi:hypothetical protein